MSYYVLPCDSVTHRWCLRNSFPCLWVSISHSDIQLGFLFIFHLQFICLFLRWKSLLFFFKADLHALTPHFCYSLKWLLRRFQKNLGMSLGILSISRSSLRLERNSVRSWRLNGEQSPRPWSLHRGWGVLVWCWCLPWGHAHWCRHPPV